LAPDAAKVAQWMPVPGPPAAAPAGTLETATSTTVASAVAPPPAAAPAPPAPGAAKPERAGPVTGSITPLPPPAAAKKKGKTGSTTHRDHKSREEELRKTRQEVVQKLKFQNSFDTGPKPRLPKAKDHDKTQATQTRVAEYRTSKEAQAKVAELHKKGVKATLKKTKDSKGTLYIVYKPASPVQPGSERLVQKPDKSRAAPGKPQPE
jgi:hypothetical protein